MLLLILSPGISAQDIFHTSICYDLLSTIDKFGEEDKLNEFYQATGLSNDSVFIACAAKVQKSDNPILFKLRNIVRSAVCDGTSKAALAF